MKLLVETGVESTVDPFTIHRCSEAFGMAWDMQGTFSFQVKTRPKT